MPTVNDEGLEGRLSPHFGSAPYFTLVDGESGEVQVVENGNARHEHGRCSPVQAIRALDVGAVICRGLGKRAFAGLRVAGVDVLVTEEWKVQAAVDAFKSGYLERLTSAAACQGGLHGHR